jgi:phage N-6-adenine-methyltransferase
MFSSASSEWGTPWYVIHAVENLLSKTRKKRTKFTLDACAASSHVAKVPRFWSPSDDALTQKWTGHVWMNPPYGRKIGLWIEKALDEVRVGHTNLVCCLLPARTDTQYFHRLCTKGDVYLIEGRIAFEVDGVAGDAAPFPSMLVVFTRDLLRGAIAPIIQPWKIPNEQL